MSAKTITEGLPNLARLRTLKSMTRGQLAAELGVTERSVGRWENGESDPVLGSLKQIAAYFGVSVAYLIGEVNEFGRGPEQR